MSLKDKKSSSSKALLNSRSQQNRSISSQQNSSSAKTTTTTTTTTTVARQTNSSKNFTKKKNNNPNQTDKSSSLGGSSARKRSLIVKEAKEKEECDNSNEMATKIFPNIGNADEVIEQETDVDNENNEETNLLVSGGFKSKFEASCSASKEEKLKAVGEEQALPSGWEQHTDKLGPYFWHVSTGIIQRNRPTKELTSESKDLVLICHDDEEINVNTQRTSSDEDDYFESGAALTVDDTSESTFVVYPIGCCDFDETQLVSTTSTKAIQKCILRLSNKPSVEESQCWGLNQSQPVLLQLFDDHIRFTDITTKTLLCSQPIQTIKTWAVDDDNNFAFVIEERMNNFNDNDDYALLNEPTLACYVFRSLDDDDMSCKVASKLNEEINRYKEQMSNRISKSTRMQQMIEKQEKQNSNSKQKQSAPIDLDQTDVEEESLDDELEASNEMMMNVKYIGQTVVPRPVGVDILNVAIDKCLAEASKAQLNRSMKENNEFIEVDSSPLIEAKLHVSPSSVIVENELTGEIIVECRIRYLTFMGISKRDIRWCGFIMQNSTNKMFIAHCFECLPTAGHVCEAIQLSCSKMYEKVVKSNNSRLQQETMSIIPTSSKIRDTLAKTFSRIRLNQIPSLH